MQRHSGGGSRRATEGGASPAWIIAVIIGRELAVTALRSIGYSRGISMPASQLGKVKMHDEHAL